MPDGIRPLRDGVLDWADRGSVWTWLDTRFAEENPLEASTWLLELA